MTVERVAVVPELDEHAVATEAVDEVVQRALGGGGTVALQRGGHRALTAAGGDEPVVVVRARTVRMHACSGRVGEAGKRRARSALLPRQLRVADRLRKTRVADGPLREH